MKLKPKIANKKGNMVVVVMMVVLVVVLAGISLAKNANGMANWFYDDVESFTDPVEGCKPKMYLVEMHGTLDLINDFIGLRGYEIHYIDAHISDISLHKLGIVSNKFDSEVCLEDMGGKSLMCNKISGKITKGRIEKFPFSFKYNLPDNDCNGQVDDHTFNIVTRLNTQDGFERQEKTVAIVNGKAVFQNVDY